MDTPLTVRAEAGDSLAMALIALSSTPLLLLDGALNLVATSE